MGRGMASLTLVVAACLAVLAVACGGEEEGGGPPTGTPAAAETPTPSEVEEVQGITPTQIILGSHFAQSGTWGAAYAPVLDGMRAYFKYVNEEEGGVCGREIVFKVEDDQYLPSGAVEVVSKLLDRDKVFAMIGCLGTAAHAAVWEDLNERGVPDLWIMSGAHMFGAEPEKYPWSIPGLPDYYVEGTIFGKYISENFPGKKVGILYQNDDYGQDELAGLKNGLDPEKNELVSEQSYEITAISIRSQVTNLKNDGAEVVVGACIPPGCAQLVREADRLGWHPQYFLGYVNSDPMMFQYVGQPELLEGAITLGATKLSDWTDDPAVAEHHRIMNEYGTMPAGNFTMVGHAVGWGTVAALRNTCDDLTPQGLMNSIYDYYRDFEGEFSMPGLTSTLSPTDHLLAESMMLLEARVEDGKGRWEFMSEETIYFEKLSEE